MREEHSPISISDELLEMGYTSRGVIYIENFWRDTMYFSVLAHEEAECCEQVQIFSKVCPSTPERR